MRVGGPAVVVGLVLTLGGCAGSTTAYPSPDGRLSVEVTKDTHLPEVVWRVVVQVGVAGTVGSWDVGCLDDRDPPTVVTWTGTQTFRVGTRAGDDVAVQVETSGRPVAITPADAVLRACPST